MVDKETLFKEKIVCTYNDIIQLPDYVVCQYIKSYRSYFDFYIDIDALNNYNDNTLMRLSLARTDKDIFKCLKKPSVEYKPEFRDGIYKLIRNLYDDAPILNAVKFINEASRNTDFIDHFSILIDDKRQKDKLAQIIHPNVQCNILDRYEPAALEEINDSTIIITDDIELINYAYERDILKRYLVPVTGYLAKLVDNTYIFNDKCITSINMGAISAVTFYQPFNFSKEHLTYKREAN